MSNLLKLFLTLLLVLSFCELFSEDKETSPLIMQQERIQQLIAKLDEKFLRLSESLKEKEPENAKLLLAAFKKSKETLIQLKVDGSIKLLKDLDLQKALDSQQKILDDLFNILNALTDLDFTNKDEIKRLENQKKKIDKLIKDEFKIKNESTKIEDKKQAIEKYIEEILKLEALIKESESTLQNSVESRIKGLAQLSGIAKNLERQAKITAQIFEKIAGFPLENIKLELPIKIEEQKIIEVPVDISGKVNQSSEPGTVELNKAFDFFGTAEKGIVEGKPFISEKSQKDAIESLKKALSELQKEKDRIVSLPENYVNELVKAQDKVLDEFEKMNNDKSQNSTPVPSEKEKGSEEKNEGKNEDGENKESKGSGDGKGEKGEGESGKGEQAEGKKDGEDQKDPAKSKNPYDQAKKYMEESSKDLKEKEIAKAKKKQDKTIEELKKIKEEIDKTLAQLRKEENEEKLTNLENRFIEILQREKVVKELTIPLEQFKEKSPWTRIEKIKCVNLMNEQIQLKELVIRAEDILLEDASTIVFPDIVNQLKEDMATVVEFLKNDETGKITQAMESEVIQTLEEMVEALGKAKEDAKKDAQSSKDNGGGGSNPNQLISQSSELKLLRKMQLRVNRMTKLFTEESKNSELPDAKKELKKVYDKQKQVLEITRKMNERKQQ